MKKMSHPLMKNNITKEDRRALIDFLETDPILTNSSQVREFEARWSQWLGVKYSVMVNSGSSANFLTMAILKEKFGEGEVLVPALTWVSDVASILSSGLTPVFVDIHPRTLGMDLEQVKKKYNSKTRAVFLTHILGLNALSADFLQFCQEKKLLLIEDVCESHGATFQGKKLGSLGALSNFSFYYAHHLSTVEGGMVCTNDEEFYRMARMFRSHGMVREAGCPQVLERYQQENPELHPEFIFAYPGYNFRSTEINAVLGLSQLARLDTNNERRRENFKLFLEHLDPEKFVTDFELEGQSSYALILILREKKTELMERVMACLRAHDIEFRRGTSGGGNQLRQPYLKSRVKEKEYLQYPATEHIHFYGMYIGNYPELERQQILQLCHLVNKA